MNVIQLVNLAMNGMLSNPFVLDNIVDRLDKPHLLYLCHLRNDIYVQISVHGFLVKLVEGICSNLKIIIK